jgi:hypothetical protein
VSESLYLREKQLITVDYGPVALGIRNSNPLSTRGLSIRGF